jgi:hypothetical protein
MEAPAQLHANSYGRHSRVSHPLGRVASADPGARNRHFCGRDPKPMGPDDTGGRKTLCHYFIRDGKIEFCGDCPHELAGQTVPLPDVPAGYENW